MKYVQQGLVDCGPACIAMITGTSLSTMRRFFNKNTKWDSKKKGTTPLDMLQALETLGYAFCYSSNTPLVQKAAKRKANALLLVKSLNSENGLHWVLLYQGKIYDPQFGKTRLNSYKKHEIKKALNNCSDLIEFKKAK